MTDLIDNNPAADAPASVPHPFDYYYEAGDELRPPPKRIASSPNWFQLRARVLGSWREITETPPRTPLAERLEDHFWQGDRHIDPLVRLAFDVGIDRVRAMLDQAIDHGIDTVDAPPAELVELFAHVDRKPAWFDADMYERGRIALANQTLFGGLGGLIVNTVMTTQGLGVGAATGATGRFVRDFHRRNVETIEYFRRVSQPGSHERFSEGFRTNLRVRFMHGLVRANLRKRWGEDSFAEKGNPISASDMALGVPAYSTINLLIDNRLGYNHSVSDIDAVAMFWSYTAYIFGVPDTLIPRNGDEANEMFDFILSTYGRESSAWSVDLSARFCESLVESYVPEDSAVRAVVGRKLVLPLLAGYFHYICGSPVTDRMFASLGYTRKQLQRYSSIAGSLAGVAVRLQRAVDSRPGRARRRVANAKTGVPFTEVQAAIAAHQAEQVGITDVTYRGHDGSSAEQFDKR